MLFCRFWIFFLIKFFKKNLSGIPSDCRTVWIQIRPDKTDQARHFVGPDLGPNCLQSYQQTTKVTTSGERVRCRKANKMLHKWRNLYQESFVQIDHEIFSTVILSLPLIQEGQLSVSGERKCTILVNRLED